jgi:endo-1,4-beta-xylanase
MKNTISNPKFRNCVQIPIFILIIAFLLSIKLNAQITDGKCKFLGNVIANSVPSNIATYWNQVTPENSGKWGSVESTRDKMNWNALDVAYKYAKSKGFPFKQHNFVWGQQQPGWIDTLSQSEQKDEVDEWIKLFGERYPETDFIDVVNEPLHAPPVYSAALGGNGKTGWDWVIWTFQEARKYCPNAKLILNDYGILNSNSATDQYLQIITLLQDSGLIDGIGEQGHGFENADANTLGSNLAKLANTGLPIYISEYDINLADDNVQLQKFQEQFPSFWECPAIKGITFWGYIQGQIWKQDAYLIRKDGSERPALSWLRTYVASAYIDNSCNTGTNDNKFLNESEIELYPNPINSDGILNLKISDEMSILRIIDLDGKIMKEINMIHQNAISLEIKLKPGIYLMQINTPEKLVIKKLVVI